MLRTERVKDWRAEDGGRPPPCLGHLRDKDTPWAGSVVFFISYRQRYLPQELVHGQHLNLVSTEAAALEVLSFTLAIWMSAHRVLPAALTPSSSSLVSGQALPPTRLP